MYICRAVSNLSTQTPLLSLGIPCSPLSPSLEYIIAAGTALHNTSEGPTASILFWDIRQPSLPLHVHESTHSDDITVLAFAPSRNSDSDMEGQTEKPEHLLLSGSSDGLLALSNPLEQDSDECVWRVANWGCSISQAGFTPQGGVWSASDMETFRFWTNELDSATGGDLDVKKLKTRGWKTDYLICSQELDDGLGAWVGDNEYVSYVSTSL